MATLKNTTVAGTGAIQLPAGTSAQRPGSPQTADMRFNDDFNTVEYYDGSTWRYMPDIVRDNLVLNLDAGEPNSYSGSGTSWNDLTSSGNNAILRNGPTFNSSNGGSIDFDGSNDYADTGSVATTATSNVTIESWANLTSTSLKGPFIYNGTSGGYGIGVGSGTYDTTGNDIIVLFQSIRWINTGVSYGGTGWVHAVLTLNGSSVPYVYVNGNFIGSYSGTAPNTPATETCIAFDYPGGGSTRFFGGRVSVGRVYNRYFTAQDVYQNFQALRGRYGI